MSPVRMSKYESAMRVVLAFNEAFNGHDVEGMMQLIGDDCKFEHYQPAPDGAVYSGKEEIRLFLGDFNRESPNAYVKIEEVFSIGERCIMRWKFSWSGVGGVDDHLRGVDIFRVKNDTICEKLSYVKG